MRLVRLERQQSRVADDVRAALASLGRGRTVVGGIALVGVGSVADRPLEAVVVLPHGVIIVIGVDLPDPALRLEAPLGGPWKADGWPLVADDDAINPATDALDVSQACERRIAELVPGTAPVGTVIAVGPYVETVDQPARDLAGPVRVLHPTPTTMLAAAVSLATARRPRSLDQARALIRGLAPAAPEFTDEVLLGEGFSRFTDDEPAESMLDTAEPRAAGTAEPVCEPRRPIGDAAVEEPGSTGFPVRAATEGRDDQVAAVPDAPAEALPARSPGSASGESVTASTGSATEAVHPARLASGPGDAPAGPATALVAPRFPGAAETSEPEGTGSAASASVPGSAGPNGLTSSGPRAGETPSAGSATPRFPGSAGGVDESAGTSVVEPERTEALVPGATGPDHPSSGGISADAPRFPGSTATTGSERTDSLASADNTEAHVRETAGPNHPTPGHTSANAPRFPGTTATTGSERTDSPASADNTEAHVHETAGPNHPTPGDNPTDAPRFPDSTATTGPEHTDSPAAADGTEPTEALVRETAGPGHPTPGHTSANAPSFPSSTATTGPEHTDSPAAETEHTEAFDHPTPGDTSANASRFPRTTTAAGPERDDSSTSAGESSPEPVAVGRGLGRAGSDVPSPAAPHPPVAERGPAETERTEVLRSGPKPAAEESSAETTELLTFPRRTAAQAASGAVRVMPPAAPVRSRKPRKAARWVPAGAIGLLVALAVAAVVVAGTGEDTAATPPVPVPSQPTASPTPTPPPPVTSGSPAPAPGPQFTLRATAADQRCASHAFGDAQASLQQTSCTGVRRASYSAVVDGRAGAVTVGVVSFSDAAQAAAFKAVVDTPGGGGILDLAGETGQWGGPAPRFENAAYVSRIEGASVRLVQAVWVPGPSTADDPGLARAAKTALDLPAS